MECDDGHGELRGVRREENKREARVQESSGHAAEGGDGAVHQLVVDLDHLAVGGDGAVGVAQDENRGWVSLTVSRTNGVVGELTVDYGKHGTRTYKKGDSLMEAMNVAHFSVNNGAEPVRLLAVYMGARGARDVVPVK